MKSRNFILLPVYTAYFNNIETRGIDGFYRVQNPSIPRVHICYYMILPCVSMLLKYPAGSYIVKDGIHFMKKNT